MSEGIVSIFVGIIIAVLLWMYPEAGPQIRKRFWQSRERAKLRRVRRKIALTIVLANPFSLIVYLLRSVLLVFAFVGMLLALWGAFLLGEAKNIAELMQAFLAYLGGLSLYVFCMWRAYLRGRRRRFSSINKLEKQRMSILSSLK